MPALSSHAQAELDRYLRNVRASLRGHASIDVEDVEQDVQSHIHAALAGASQPIDFDTLRRVLQQLGPPHQWAPADDLPSWRIALARLRSGPEDWRLPYLTFLCFLAGPTLFFFDVGSVRLWPLPPILMIASFVLARASVAVVAAQGESLEAVRWLLYPPLLFGYALIAAVLLGWPIVVLVLASNEPAARDWIVELPGPTWAGVTLVLTLALGAWWMVAGLLIHVFRSTVRALFWPLAERLARRHAIAVSGAGLVLIGIAALVYAI